MLVCEYINMSKFYVDATCTFFTLPICYIYTLVYHRLTYICIFVLLQHLATKSCLMRSSAGNRLPHATHPVAIGSNVSILTSSAVINVTAGASAPKQIFFISVVGFCFACLHNSLLQLTVC